MFLVLVIFSNILLTLTSFSMTLPNLRLSVLLYSYCFALLNFVEPKIPYNVIPIFIIMHIDKMLY